MSSPSLTFDYQLGLRPDRWMGQGSGRSFFMDVEGLAGPKPRFELRSGWLTLFPTEGWARSFPTHALSGQPKRHEMGKNARVADAKAHGEIFSEAEIKAMKEAAKKFPPKENLAAFIKAHGAVWERSLRRRGMTRDFASFCLFVGDMLSSALQTGDELKYSRGGNGDFHYSVKRNSETVFSAGTVGRSDPGGSMAVWQEYDRYPTTNARKAEGTTSNSKICGMDR